MTSFDDLVVDWELPVASASTVASTNRRILKASVGCGRDGLRFGYAVKFPEMITSLSGDEASMKNSWWNRLAPATSVSWLVATLALLPISGGCNPEVGSVKLPEAKDRGEALPGFDPNAKSPYQKGAVLKKPTAPTTEGKVPLNPKL